MANAYDDFIPEIWSGQILDELDKRLVLANVANTSWAGDISNVGDTVRILGVGSVTAAAYTNNSTSITYSTPTDSSRSLVIDTDYYGAVQVDDAEQIQAVTDLLGRYAQRIAYALAKQVDTSIAGLYTEAGLTKVTVTASDDMYDKIVDARKILEEADNEGPYWLAVSPAAAASLRKNTKFVSAEGEGQTFRQNGVLGRIAGFEVYESNNLTDVSGEDQCLFGTPLSIAHARKLGNIESIRLESRFATGLRARLIWGNKVLDSTRLGVLGYTA
jgi:hypothetical protein